MAKQDVTLEEFLDLAGHELRIPITALKGQIQLLQRRWSRMDDRQAEVADLGRLLFQIDRLNSMLQVMLDAFHAMHADLQLLPAEFEYDLVDLVVRVVSSASTIPSHQLHFARVGGDDAPMMGNWDRMRIETVLNVLLANAVKYSPPGEILIRLTRDGATARIEVSDAGIGVPVKDRAQIFQPYTHSSNVENPGLGLGLYVARAIVRAHGGQMGLRARKGGGSTFWLTLPRGRYTPLSEQTATGTAVRSTAPRSPGPARAAARRR
jgi:signal transduction histidine kinase